MSARSRPVMGFLSTPAELLPSMTLYRCAADAAANDAKVMPRRD
jgi:hypothetical protein